MADRIPIRSGRMSLRIVVVLALILAVMVPVAVVAAGGSFTDDDTSVFEADIEWLVDHGITFGCNPPANDNYCPGKAVTRGQMAAFMHRLADDQSNDGFSVYHDDAKQITGSSDYVTILELPGLPAGSYVIIAKAHAQSGSGSNTSFACRLYADNQFDNNQATLEPFHHVPASWTVVNTFAADDSSATLQCRDFGSDVDLYNIKITAIGVNNLSNSSG